MKWKTSEVSEKEGGIVIWRRWHSSLPYPIAARTDLHEERFIFKSRDLEWWLFTCEISLMRPHFYAADLNAVFERYFHVF